MAQVGYKHGEGIIRTGEGGVLSWLERDYRKELIEWQSLS